MAILMLWAALLLQDSRNFSGEMAKASVSLSMASYSESYVDEILLNYGAAVRNYFGYRTEDLTSAQKALVPQ